MVEPFYQPEPHVLKWLRRFIQPSDRILDVGSGDGRFRDIGGQEYWSLDIWPPAEPDYFLDLELSDLPRDRTFDVVMLIDVLEHLTKRRGVEILRQARKLAQRAVIVFTPLYWDENREAYEEEGGFYQNNDYVLHRSRWFVQDFGHDFHRVIVPSAVNCYFGYWEQTMTEDIMLVGQVCMHNEVDKGNLDRCLDNLRQYCDRIVIWDDGSTDDSVVVAEQYGCTVIRGGKNDQMNELAHKQAILEKSLELGATHLFWLDCDEVLDRQGTMGGVRNLCKHWPDGIDAYGFRELNLWRSQTWVRQDSLFTKALFVRLWKVVPGIHIEAKHGVHLRLYPSHITPDTTLEAPYGVIHYGYWDYKRMMVKIGAHGFDQIALEKNAKKNWILNETACSCYKLPDNKYPPGTLPPDIWSEPQPIAIANLLTYDQIPDEPSFPLVDSRAMGEWTQKHDENYHGDYESIRDINRGIWQTKKIDPVNRLSLFTFDPADKNIVDWGCGTGKYALDCIINGAKKVFCFEVDQKLIDKAKRSFEEIGVPEDKYRFINVVTEGIPNMPMIDLIYSVAVWMHLPFWQCVRTWEVLEPVLKHGAEAHFQFYQANDNFTMFLNNQDRVSTIRMERVLTNLGFTIEERRLATGPNIHPVWYMYRLKKNYGEPNGP